MLLHKRSKKGISFSQFFKITFVVFFLYLLGDAFYRWDGFRYYGTFSEFIPAVALASVLWTILAVITSILIWPLIKFCVRVCRLLHLNLGESQFLFSGLIFIIAGAIVWRLKKVFYPDIHTTVETKFIVLLAVLLFSFLTAFLLRHRTDSLMGSLNKRITPLLWVFIVLVFISLPLVVYKMRWDYGPFAKTWTDSTSGDDRPNIILVTFDALSARKMSLYGYHRKTTPFIDEWSKKATVFTRVEAASNFTTSATASLMTGKRVWTHRVFHLEGSKPINSETESLPALLKKNGYFNMAFVVNPHTSVEVLGMSDSFDIAPLASEFSIPRSLFGWKFGTVESSLYRLFGDKIRLHNWLLQRDFILHRMLNIISRNFSVTEAPPEEAFRRFLNILDKNPPQPFFAWIHLFPPHDPYLPPRPYKGYFSDSSELRDYKSQEAIRMEAFKYTFQYKPFPEKMQPVVNLLRAYYDEFVRYCDSTFADFIGELERRGVTDNTIIILSSDHGESFEHGYFTHGGPFLYEEVTHIPLIIKEPNQEKGVFINNLVEQIDIPATILNLVNLQVPSWMEGRSLVPIMRGEGLSQRAVFSMNFEENQSKGHQIRSGSIAVWEGDYKLINYLKKKKSVLFNLRIDPEESNDLSSKEPEIENRLRSLIGERIKGG